MYTHTTYMHIVHATGWVHRTDVWSDEDTVKGVCIYNRRGLEIMLGGYKPLLCVLL